MIVAGMLYVVFGVLAFFNIPGGHDQHHHTFAHNLTHILIGVVLFTVAIRSRPAVRQMLCLILAVGYLALSAFGASIGQHSTLVLVPGLIEFHAGDYTVHFASGLFFAALAFLKRSDEPRWAS